MAIEKQQPQGLFMTTVQPLQQFHESLRLPGPKTLLSKLALTLAYLALLTILPNAFGWTLALLCVLAPSLRMFLFEPWAIDGNLQFNSFCWQLQFVVNLLVGSVYGGLSFILWPISGILRLHITTVWVCLASALPIYATVTLLSKAYHVFRFPPQFVVFPVVVLLVHRVSYDQGARSQAVYHE